MNKVNSFTTGIFWKTIGIYFILALLVGVISSVFSLPGMLMMFVSIVSGLASNNTMHDSSFLMLLSGILISIGAAISYLLYAILFAGQAVLYHGEMEKEFGINTKKMIDEIGNPEFNK
jgi:hypothetical protein